jgi:hypothetical protein
MAKLVQLFPVDSSGRTFFGLDEDGDVLRGEIKRDREGADYIEWKRVRSEMPRD